MKTLHRFPISPDIAQALSEFTPLAATLPFEDETLEGSIPVITPQLADVNCVACVYADPHQDLPYPRYSVLAPIKVRPDAQLFVQNEDGSIQSSPLSAGEIVVLDSHQKHWVNKPKNYPANWDEWSTTEKRKYKQENMIVFANLDFQEYPTPEMCESRLRKLLCLDAPAPKSKPKKGMR